MQERAVSLVGSGPSAGLQALSHSRDVASLSLFYKYYYGKCSSELVDLVPPKRVTARSTRFSEQMQRHTVNSPICRTKFYQLSFFSRTAALWNSIIFCVRTKWTMTCLSSNMRRQQIGIFTAYSRSSIKNKITSHYPYYSKGKRIKGVPSSNPF